MIFPLAFIFIIILDKILFGPRNDFYNFFAGEDGPIEYATSIVYFLSFVFSVILTVIFIRQKKNLLAILFLLLSIPFFIIAMEEISWGQRIFDVENTGFFLDNLQNETNFHNLPIINEYLKFYFLIVSAVGFISWVFFTYSNKLKDKSYTKYFVPPTFTILYLISVLFYYEMLIFEQFLPKSTDGLLLYVFQYPDHEIFEFILSLGIFICLTSKLIKLKNQNKILKL